MTLRAAGSTAQTKSVSSGPWWLSAKMTELSSPRSFAFKLSITLNQLSVYSSSANREGQRAGTEMLKTGENNGLSRARHGYGEMGNTYRHAALHE